MNRIDEVLNRMRMSGEIIDIDEQFARLMARLDETGGAPLAVAAALVSAASLRGDTGILLDELEHCAATWLGGDHVSAIAALKASDISGDGSSNTPIVVDADRACLYRFWDYERRLADSLVNRNAALVTQVDPATLRAPLDRLFPGAAGDGIDWQKTAAALAMMRRLLIISGGPGTGKTSTMVRILALLIETQGDACRIALAAPTGKAAARMQQAVDEARGQLDVSESIRAAIPGEASTIHRLLRARSRGGGFRHKADNPLSVDVLVVDEVSMVDVALMTRLMEAVPKDARVILLGDHDQLASVEPGSVFADLCLGANRFSKGVATALHHATGHAFKSTPVEVLADASVLLSRSYRFDTHSGIGALSIAVRDGHAEGALELLDDPAREDIALMRELDDASFESTLYDTLLPHYRARIESIRNGGEPAVIFSGYRAMQVLCALRKGPFGVSGINARIEHMLSEQQLIEDGDPWYPGRPIMITTNDYGLGLFNGDLGIVLPHRESGTARACFLGEGRDPLWVHPARLPEHETAWAMTVHKSQGSEFNHVVVVLPQQDSPVLSRELLYTAISRARHKVDIHANEGILAQAIHRRVERRGGLARSLATRSA